MDIAKKILASIYEIVQHNRKNVSYLLYYTVLEGVLALSIPLASSFIVNSILAHAFISIAILALVVTSIVILTTFLQLIKEYIVEKFQQKIFVDTAIKTAIMANLLRDKSNVEKSTVDKNMNYFFDITSLQKLFPIILLDGSGLIVKLIVSLLLFLVFDPILFAMGVFFVLLFIVLFILLGRKGAEYAIRRSDSKHNAIYYLQHIPEQNGDDQSIFSHFDALLVDFVETRQRIFSVIIRQLTLTYFMEGIVFISFLTIGGYMVINGHLPLGEFIATEIAVVYLTYALRSFMKHIDYIYDIIEGLYKVDKLSDYLEKSAHE